MNAQQIVMLCRFAKAACPQQAIDEATPDAWQILLGDIRFEDAQTALATIAKRQPFVAPAEIRTEVKARRETRIAQGPQLQPPPGTADDELAYRRWLAESRRRIADGEPIAEPDALPARDVGVIANTFREVPTA